MKKAFRGLLLLLAVFLTLYFSYPFILTGMANYLIVRDKLGKADLILVLGGDSSGERVVEGVKLYKQGYAKRILMSGGPLYRELTYAGLMKRQSLESGVPEKAVLLQAKSRSTLEDAQFSLPIVKAGGYKSIILVTSPTHTRRAARVFRRIYSKEGIKVMVQPVEKSEFSPDRWWTRHEDAGLVVWEYVSSVLYLLK